MINVMKLVGRAILLCGISLVVVLAALAQKHGIPSVAIEGTYENLTVGKESGDLEGMLASLISTVALAR